MLESLNVCGTVSGVCGAGLRTFVVVLGCAAALSGCATPEATKSVEPTAAPAPVPDSGARLQESRALLAQAETDVQRARARRALWLKAWESLVLARQAAAAEDSAGAARHAKLASELARLGLEQLAYPAVK